MPTNETVERKLSGRRLVATLAKDVAHAGSYPSSLPAHSTALRVLEALYGRMAISAPEGFTNRHLGNVLTILLRTLPTAAFNSGEDRAIYRLRQQPDFPSLTALTPKELQRARRDIGYLSSQFDLPHPENQR